MSEEEAVGEVSSLATSNAPRLKKRKAIEAIPELSGDENVDEEDNNQGASKRRTPEAEEETDDLPAGE
jgi:hypothetical protein